MATRTRPRPSERQSPTRQSRLPGRLAGRFATLQRTARDTWAESKKITWPNREMTRNLTLLVIAISAVLGLLLGGVDAGFVKLWNLLGNVL